MTATIPETWRPIKDYEGLYEISSHGKVRTLRARTCCKDPNGILSLQNMNGSYGVVLHKDKTTKTATVSHLVYQAFNDWDIEMDDIVLVEHLDNDISNNHFDNLLVHITPKAANKIHEQMCIYVSK